MPTYHVAAPINKAEIEAVTLRLRGLLGCNDMKYLPVAKIIEHSLPGLLGDDYAFRVVDAAEMGANHAYAEPDENELVLRDDIYYGIVQGIGRDRMTAMHEVAHILLHTNNRLFRSMQSEPPPPWRDPEWQAKCFAGMIMMPTDLIAGYQSVGLIARDFGVSQAAATHRLSQMRHKRK